MHIFGICSVLCLLISNVIDVSEAECDEYFVVLEEHICSDGKGYKVIPLRKENINWDNVTYPCNSTVEDFEKECLVEFNYNSTEALCTPHKNVKNTQSHSFTPAIPNPITDKPEAPEVTTNKLTEVTEIPHYGLDDKFTMSICDINIHYINKHSIRNDSKTTSETTKNETFECISAEIVCLDELKPENESLSKVKNTANNTYLEEHASNLQISINRDTTSPVQPMFTGYFPELSNDSPKNYNSHFEFLKTMSTSCPIPKHNNCKENFQINIYIEVNYIKNNTIAKYPNCTLISITSEDGVNVTCEDILFAKHNPHIAQTVPAASPKQKMLICQVKDLKYTKLSSSDHNSENNNYHFINCSNNNKVRDSNITPTSDSKNITIQTETPVEISKDNSSQENPKNMVTIFITENINNCSQKIPFNIDEGKIIDLGIKKKDIFLRNNDIYLILSNCINYNYSIINDKQPIEKRAELTIILKNESLNASNLEQFNGSPRDKSLKQKILLQCNNHNHDSNSNATYNKTILQCESIDLEFYNITGIYITPSSQISNDKTAIKSENEIKQFFLNYCQILELNNTSKEHRNKTIYFKNCSKDIHINNSKNNSEDKNIERIFDGENKYTKDEFNKTENPSEKFNQNKPPPSKSKNMIKILITEIPNNCSNHSSFIIDEGKIINLDVNTNQEKILQNNIIDLKISKCIDVYSSFINETHTDLNVDLTIIMKNESLNAANLQLFNGTAKNKSIKQRILLRCEYSNFDSSRKATSDKNAIHCELIDLDSSNITGIETNTEGNQSITNINKERIKENVEEIEVIENTTIKNVQLDRNGKLSTNKIVDNNANNKSLEKKEIQKNISETNGSHENKKKNVENNEKQKTISKRKEISTNLVFNRKKDIPNGAGQNSLGLGSSQLEKTMLITLLAVVGAGILMVLAWRVWPKKKEYSPAPTREPPDEEETAF